MEKKINFEEVRDNTKKNLKHAASVVKEKVNDGIQWGLDHPEMVVAGIGATAGLVKASQSFVVSRRVKAERKRIDHTYYDPSTGFHWELRRKATNAERGEILRRKQAGQDMYEILTQMRLIK